MYSVLRTEYKVRRVPVFCTAKHGGIGRCSERTVFHFVKHSRPTAKRICLRSPPMLSRRSLFALSCLACLSWSLPCPAQQKVSGGPLAGTEKLTAEGDIAAQMVAGIDFFLLRELE